MKGGNIMKMKKSVQFFSVLFSIIVVAGCSYFSASSSNESSSTQKPHECEHACLTCELCYNTECQEEECKEKCVCEVIQLPGKEHFIPIGENTVYAKQDASIPEEIRVEVAQKFIETLEEDRKPDSVEDVVFRGYDGKFAGWHVFTIELGSGSTHIGSETMLCVNGIVVGDEKYRHYVYDGSTFALMSEALEDGTLPQAMKDEYLLYKIKCMRASGLRSAEEIKIWAYLGNIKGYAVVIYHDDINEAIRTTPLYIHGNRMGVQGYPIAFVKYNEDGIKYASDPFFAQHLDAQEFATIDAAFWAETQM